MTHQIVKQPNGLYAVWSTVVDDFILIDATPEDIIQDRIEESNEQIREGTMKTIEALERGEKPYLQFTRTFVDCVRIIKRVHGKNAESLQLLGLVKKGT